MFWDLLKAILSVLGFVHSRDEARRKYRLDDEIEGRLLKLLSDPDYQRRTFKTIRGRIGGFDETPDELRRHLVRIGAERRGTPGDEEFWGLSDGRRKSVSKFAKYRKWIWRVLGIVAILLAAATVLNLDRAEDEERRKLIKCLEDNTNC